MWRWCIFVISAIVSSASPSSVLTDDSVNGLAVNKLSAVGTNVSGAIKHLEHEAEPGPVQVLLPERSYWRWLYWVLIVYMFYAQATVCDHYFVESIKIIVDRFDIPEDVAGATLMALGCNGPELATNFIALFITHSSVGVGTIVGSEIFNLLCIVAGCALVSPVPMEINVIPFYRDCFFYALSIGLLMWVLRDGVVSSTEASILLACGALFVVTVAMTQRISEKLGFAAVPDQIVVLDIPVPVTPDVPAHQESRKMSITHKATRSSTFFVKSELRSLMKDGEVEVTVSRHNRMQDSHAGGSAHSSLHHVDFNSSGIHIDINVANLQEATTLPGAATCNVALGIRPKSIVGTSTKFKLGLSTPGSSRGVHNSPNQPSSVNTSLTPPEAALQRPGPVTHKRSDRPKIPMTGTKQDPLKEPLIQTPSSIHSECSGSEIYVPEELGQGEPSLKYSDIVRAHDFGIYDIQLDIRCDWNELVTVQMHANNEEMISRFLRMLEQNNVKVVRKEGMREVMEEIVEEITDEQLSVPQKIFAFLTFPVSLILTLSMCWCDPNNITKQDRWLACFCASMTWLAFFSYLMCWASDRIHEEFGIPQTMLGVTLCAVGTSFPNFWASILMAKDGRSSMAVSNALGSNVQNVFLALAVPWLFRTMIPTEHTIPMNAHGIFSGVLWMAGTLAALLFMVVCGRNKISKIAGGILVSMYLVYLTLVIMPR